VCEASRDLHSGELCPCTHEHRQSSNRQTAYVTFRVSRGHCEGALCGCPMPGMMYTRCTQPCEGKRLGKLCPCLYRCSQRNAATSFFEPRGVTLPTCVCIKLHQVLFFVCWPPVVRPQHVPHRVGVTRHWLPWKHAIVHTLYAAAAAAAATATVACTAH
jgi:hypothetical protein